MKNELINIYNINIDFSNLLLISYLYINVQTLSCNSNPTKKLSEMKNIPKLLNPNKYIDTIDIQTNNKLTVNLKQ